MKILKDLNYLFCFTMILGSVIPIYSQTASGYLCEDGAWCWFSDPRAIIIGDKVIAGWVRSNGTVEAGRLDLSSGQIETSDLYYRLEVDDHNNPSLTTSYDGEVIAMYTRHGKQDLFINKLEDPHGNFEFAGAQMIHPWSIEELEKFPRKSMSYANVVMLNDENSRIYCFGRWTGFKPNMIWSDDNGKSWSKSRVFITNFPFDSHNRPYVKYHSDGKSKVHIIFTDGHPRDEPTNSVYYAYYEENAFYNVDGQLISSMENVPFEPKDASVVFRSNPEEGRAWIADIGQDSQGNPVILYTKSPTDENHEYWYARYSNNAWVSNKICDSGKWFPQTPEGKTEFERHYFGGLTVHPNDPNVVYLSRQINGIFEIERWETTDMGETWTFDAITEKSSKDNVRPYVPRGLSVDSPEVVLWMENEKYIHYTDYRTSIRYYVRN